jgi:hypothetical protein
MAKKRARKAARRELIDTGTDKRYVRRNTLGQFKESDDVGRSLRLDRKRKARTTVKSGQGDRGDRRAVARPRPDAPGVPADHRVAGIGIKSGHRQLASPLAVWGAAWHPMAWTPLPVVVGVMGPQPIGMGLTNPACCAVAAPCSGHLVGCGLRVPTCPA